MRYIVYTLAAGGGPPPAVYELSMTQQERLRVWWASLPEGAAFADPEFPDLHPSFWCIWKDSGAATDARRRAAAMGLGGVFRPGPDEVIVRRGVPGDLNTVPFVYLVNEAACWTRLNEVGGIPAADVFWEEQGCDSASG